MFVTLCLLFFCFCACHQAIKIGGASSYNILNPDPRPCETPSPAPYFTCYPYHRSIDGFCNNDARVMEGTTDSAQFSYDDARSNLLAKGSNLLSARQISNIIGQQYTSVPNKNGLTDFVTFFAQFLDHNIFATGTDKDDTLPIAIPRDDPVLCNFTTMKMMPFARSTRGCVPGKARSIVRPINCLTSVIDLAGVYGSKKEQAAQLRTMKNGLLKVQTKKKKEFLPKFKKMSMVGMTLPKNGSKKKFFAAGDHRANENPVLAALHTLFLREHNRIARELKNLNIGQGDYDTMDEALYQYAKRVNEASFQQIVAREFYPAMTGLKLPTNLGYDKSVNHAVSDLFSTCAYRVGHTLVGEEIHIRNKQNKIQKVVPVTELFFNPSKVLKKYGIEGFLRGAVQHIAEEIDIKVVDALRNHLFTNVEGEEFNVDLLALNIQRGRDHNIPSFNEIRTMFGFEPYENWDEITSDVDIQTALSTAYRKIDDVEAWVGLMAEDHEDGPMGPTLTKVWLTEFTRVLSGDKFLYTTPTFHPQLYFRVYTRQINDIIQGRRTMKNIIADNSDISYSELPESIWIMK